MQIISRSEATQLNLNSYFTGKPCKHGHIAERRVSNGECRECSRVYNNSRYSNDPLKYRGHSAKYRLNNKDKAIDGCRRWVANNPDKNKMSQMKYRENNKSKISDRERDYRANNKDKISATNKKWIENNRDRVNENRRLRLKTNSRAKLSKSMRDMISRVMICTGKKKKLRTSEILGYTPLQLRQHLESLFTDGMTWDNHGEWHIDHIVPVSWWVKNGVTDPSMINALINLQTLWAKDNLSKSDKI